MSKKITVEQHHGQRIVVLHNSEAPEEYRRIEAGRIVSAFGGIGFQPAPFMEGLFSAATLREIADLVEREA